MATAGAAVVGALVVSVVGALARRHRAPVPAGHLVNFFRSVMAAVYLAVSRPSRPSAILSALPATIAWCVDYYAQRMTSSGQPTKMSLMTHQPHDGSA